MWSSNIRYRRVERDGCGIQVYEAGDGPVVVLAHGFPELAFSWRHQIDALAGAGYRVIAPDQRGYGRADRPVPIDDYDIVHLTDDLLSVLDDAGVEKAAFVGHDWGAMVVWQMALLHPDRVAAVAGMSVPFMPRGPMPPIAVMRQIFSGAFFYMVYFQEPGVADAELGSDPARTMRRLLAGTPRMSSPEELAAYAADDGRGFVDRMPEPEGLPAWLSQAELDFYIEEFTRTGFTGGLNWYRNLDRNWALTESIAGARITVPSLFVGGALDPVLGMADPKAAEAWLDDHRATVLVEGAGHWVQQEKPVEVNDALLQFLKSVDLGSGS